VNDYVIGQRYLSQLDPHLGLGVVVDSEPRRVSLTFPAVAEDRTYAVDNAPLTRLLYRSGDELKLADGTLGKVIAVSLTAGIAHYTINTDSEQNIEISELQLASEVALNQPEQRLFNAQLDNSALYQARVTAASHVQMLDASRVRGLIAPRTLLLPHQIYLAHSVGSRNQPRVMLADEVGLGKTIEAGLIIHQQLLTQRAQRVLVLCPEPLMAQWLIEMRRKFNLYFEFLNLERLDTSQNPFEDGQLNLCSLELMRGSFEKALQAKWDLVVIDEAHHLNEAETDTYEFVETLAGQSRGLLLLTATPEQLGQEAHFKRMQLIDPDRFVDFSQYQAEESKFAELDRLIRRIEAGETVDHSIYRVPDKADSDAKIDALLDYYGTGRSLFRNSRASISGLPKRHLHPYPLHAVQPLGASLEEQLYPERQNPSANWIEGEPKVRWLTDFLRANRARKVLVICGSAQVATDLETHLHLREGIRSAAFYEGLSLIERDRAAAYFQETDNGAQVLVCSEIGSEGRNFQFSQHLVLFDLPWSPDLLEQRIGRLDRIGQKSTIHIHVPYHENTAQETLFSWYAKGLEIFTEHCAGGQTLFDHNETELKQFCLNPRSYPDYLTAVSVQAQAMKLQLAEGRNRLLERHSLNIPIAQSLIEEIRALDQNTSLLDWIDSAAEAFSLDIESHSEDTIIIRTNEQTHEGLLPFFDDDSLTGTVNREIAASREDWAFLTWEHPLIRETIELFDQQPVGAATIAKLRLKSVPQGTMLLEGISLVRATGPAELDLSKYLPRTPIRLLINAEGRDLAQALPLEALHKSLEPIPAKAGPALLKQVRKPLEQMIMLTETQANARAETIKKLALSAYASALDEELGRHRSLEQKTGRSDPAETKRLTEAKQEGLKALSQARTELFALRLILTHH